MTVFSRFSEYVASICLPMQAFIVFTSAKLPASMEHGVVSRASSSFSCLIHEMPCICDTRCLVYDNLCKHCRFFPHSPPGPMRCEFIPELVPPLPHAICECFPNPKAKPYMDRQHHLHRHSHQLHLNSSYKASRNDTCLPENKDSDIIIALTKHQGEGDGVSRRASICVYFPALQVEHPNYGRRKTNIN
jgi:hypothetical protein